MLVQHTKKITKTELAKQMGISRASLYYVHRQPLVDEEVKHQIESVLSDNPAYGHKRIALELKLNKKRILRVMRKFGIKPYRRRKTPRKKGDEGKASIHYINLIETFCPIVPDLVWVSDFTYIKYKEKFIYLATIIDQYSREAVGWNISRFHNQELVLGAFEDACKNPYHHLPKYLHSDQGSEYDSQAYTKIAEKLKIKISMSRKSSPWENSYQESYYSHFKVDLGDPNRFEQLGELIEAIHGAINYYNIRRIHTKLKMTPKQFREKYYEKQKLSTDSPSRKMGT